MPDVLPLEVAPRPPLQLAWRSSSSMSAALVTGGSVFGVTASQTVAALSTTSGSTRWQTQDVYLPDRIAAQDGTVYALKKNTGIMAVVDQGSTYTERTLLTLPDLDETSVVSQLVVLNAVLHVVMGNRLTAVSTAGAGVLYETSLRDEQPYSLYPLDGDLLVVSGGGRPARYHPGTSAYSRVWDRGSAGLGDLAERAAVVSGTFVVVADRGGVTAYHKANGSLLWQSGVGNLAVAVQGSDLYTAGNQGDLWALRLGDGSVRWNQKFLTFVSATPRVALAATESHLWVGALLSDGADPSALWAVSTADGHFTWQATGVSVPYASGLPLLVEGRLYTFGAPEPFAAMENLTADPAITQDLISQTPGVLRGAMADFGRAEITIRLPVAASVSFVSWHERDSRPGPFGPIPYGPGKVTISYDPKWPWGWTDVNQFGRLVLDIQETVSGLRYSQVLLVPVNTLPDIHNHWAKRNIEIMLYHRYIGGYPDLTFKPDNLITRAETSTIIAKTLGLERPTPGFHTKFTDIGAHWGRNYIMALEERQIINGFQESDGTFTFRPDLEMTRAQEARVLVRAYSIPAAPNTFQTRFTDIAGHWAEADIMALESGGYVTGFREPDGTYTYRPEQNLTRAELCTLVVRIRNLSR